MDAMTIGLIGLLITFLLIFIKIPIGIVMGLVGMVGIAIIISPGAAFSILQTVPFDTIGNWNLSAVPMFLLMGFIASETGLTNGLFLTARVFFGRFPGSLASSSVVACAFFASASGSSVASAAAFSKMAVPEMLKAKYDPGLATGCIASAGTLGSLIPPSVIMIIFGIIADVSISKLFMAGVFPGILSAAMFILYITIRATLRPQDAPRDQTIYTRKEKIDAIKTVWPLPVLILIVLGGIFSGIFSATEAGAVGAFLAFALAIIRRSLTFEISKKALIDTAEATAVIFIIVVGAAIFSRFMSFSGLPEMLAQWFTSIAKSQLTLILLITILFLILGAILESISIMLLTLPILLPMLQVADVNLIWFGVLTTKLLEIGLCTPPLGMNVYVVNSSLGNAIPLGKIFRGVSWFVLFDLFTLSLLIAFPIISLWLPNFLS